MRKRYWPAAAALVLSIMLSVAARGQDAPPTEEEQLQQQVQDGFRAMIGNMFAKGIDPRQFFQQMQNGTDPADIARQLVNQGVIDQASLTQLQTNAQRLTTIRIRSQLDCSDAEWAVLEPMILKVVTAQSALQRAGSSMSGGGGMRGMTGGFGTVQTPAGIDLSRAVKTLKAALQSKNPAADEVSAALATFRQARDRATADLATARRDLTSAVTARQEAALTTMGILE